MKRSPLTDSGWGYPDSTLVEGCSRCDGAELGEIMDMCQPLLDRAEDGEDAGTAEFMVEWVRVAERLIGLAEEDQEQGRLLSAGGKLQRAALYLLTAERMQGHGHPGRAEPYARARRAFDGGIRFSNANVERLEIPYDDATIPALYTRAEGADGPAPTVIHLNELDSCKELLYWSRLPEALAERGISCLCVNQPGNGEALRLQDLPATWRAEEWGTPVFEWLAARDDVDEDRIGITGISLGGFYAPRIRAFEPRIASGAVWGANHNWIEVQHKRLDREGENPVPHYWSHVQWVFGAADQEDFFDKASGMHLDGVMEKIGVPFLVTHGAHDRQISVDYAQQSYQR